MMLFKNNQQHRAKMTTSGNLPKEVLDQIDQRKEPIESVQELSNIRSIDKLNDDPTTDPEGAKARAATTDEYPPFVYLDYKPSYLNFWGKKWADNKEHLIPKNSTVAAVIQVHKDSEGKYGKMLELAYAEGNKANMKLILDAYTTMLLGVDKDFQFPIMQQLGNLANSTLANRAFQKYMYANAAARLDTTQDPPEWFAGMRDRMVQAAIQAGTWVNCHMECWKLMDYKNAPTYFVDNDVKLRLVNNAKFLEDRYGDKKQEQPKIADHLALALEC